MGLALLQAEEQERAAREAMEGSRRKLEAVKEYAQSSALELEAAQGRIKELESELAAASERESEARAAAVASAAARAATDALGALQSQLKEGQDAQAEVDTLRHQLAEKDAALQALKSQADRLSAAAADREPQIQGTIAELRALIRQARAATEVVGASTGGSSSNGGVAPSNADSHDLLQLLLEAKVVVEQVQRAGSEATEEGKRHKAVAMTHEAKLAVASQRVNVVEEQLDQVKVLSKLPALFLLPLLMLYDAI